MVDEVVIGWNGGNHTAFGSAIAEFQMVGAAPWGEGDERASWTDLLGTRFKIVKQKWTGNFAAARQETFEAASGTWRCYFDTDDIVVDWSSDGPDGRSAIVDSLKWCGVDVGTTDVPGGNVGPPKTRQDFLRALGPNVNCVEFPYDYTIGGDGKSLWRYWRRRIVRWADGWVWHSQLNYHEDLFPVGGNVVSFVRDGGLPIRHYPSQDVHERTARNRAILQTMLEETKQGKRPVDGRLLYNCATFELQGGNWLEAEKLLEQAIKAAADDADMRMYRQCRAKALIALGRYAEAVYEAAALNGHDATAYEGWAIFTECSYNRGEWQAVIEYGEHAILGRVRADATDKPVEREAHLRVMMATAQLQLGELESALMLAEAAVKCASQDALSKDCLKRIRAAKAGSDALEAAIAAAEYHLGQQDMQRLRGALDALPYGADAPGGDRRVAQLRAALARMSEIQAEECTPLPVFLAPSPWARYVGSLAKREGWKVVRVAGRPHPDDMAALRRILPEVQWLGPTDPYLTTEAAVMLVSVDSAHTTEGG
ncbi:MAG: hypothetical protein Q8S13_02295, partial [Dehalococcoidia bacterium]|nr:hypothetical protein [Dehalococcoidia bacterium]